MRPIVAIFEDPNEAEEALASLLHAGIPEQRIILRIEPGTGCVLTVQPDGVPDEGGARLRTG